MWNAYSVQKKKKKKKRFNTNQVFSDIKFTSNMYLSLQTKEQQPVMWVLQTTTYPKSVNW